MRLLDATLWAIVLLLCGVVALAPRERAPSAPASPRGTAQAAPPTGPAPQYDRRPRALDQQTIERCLEVVRDVDPARAEALERIRSDQSEESFAEALADKQFLLGLASLKNEDPALYAIRIEELRLEATIDGMVNQLIEARRTSNPAAADLQGQLRELAEMQVGLSLAARGRYWIRLNEHMKSLRDELSRDADPANFQPAVERRFKELLEQVDSAVPQPASG